MQKKNCLLVLLLALFLSAMKTEADEVVYHGDWRITYEQGTQTFKLHHKRTDGTWRPLYARSVPEAKFQSGDAERTITINDFSQMEHQQEDFTDEMGMGTHYTFRFSQPETGENVRLTLHFWGYTDKTHLLTALEIESNEDIRSNYLAPIHTTTTFNLYDANPHNRILKVPFDNDGWVRYERRPLHGETTSYEVTSLYAPDLHEGMVFGSVDHDHWKSAIYVYSIDQGRIKEMKVYSGASDGGTYDTLPHGSLVGRSIRSARFMIGYDTDWRDALDAFADACTAVRPCRNNWPYGRPVGWMSWNVLESKNSYAADSEIVKFYNDVLRPYGFHNEQDRYIISIDAWNNLSEQQERWLIQEANALDMIVGVYDVPFTTWRDPNDLSGIYIKTSSGTYTFSDVVLRANGKPIEHGGALALDPTHPAVKSRNAQYIRRKYNLGYRYFKLDFMTHGMLQADSYYNPDVHTAVEAYNEGMDYYLKQIDMMEEPVYINLSISPLFPYHHANGRRQTCDTWGTLGWSEFSVHALTAAWWTGRLYQFNDPDGLPLIGRGDQSNISLAENRTRLTSGIISGAVLLADNFSISDQSGYGNPRLSIQRAEKVLNNPDVNLMLSQKLYFRPLNGWNETGGQTGLAEPCLVSRGDDYDYLVVFHFDADQSHPNFNGKVTLEEMGLQTSNIAHVKELWTGEEVDIQDGAVHFDIPPCDCRIFRFTHVADGIASPKSAQMEEERWSNDQPLYDLSGRRVAFGNSTHLRKGLYLNRSRKVAIK